jgi:hypothetical protein
MDGVAAIRQLLVAHSPLTALVPAARVIAGVLPQGTALPAVALTSVSSSEDDSINPGSHRFITERVQATIFAQNYPQKRAILKAVLRGAADKVPTMDGLRTMPVASGGAGPDFMSEDASIHMGTHDFIIRWNDPT